MALKDFPVIKFFYNLPGASSSYHFLWAWTGARINRNPSRKIFVIGVTGTKGKTTTLELVNTILEAAGKKTALLSSLRIKIGNAGRKNHLGNSMPGHGYIQKFLNTATREGCTYALIEVTSQGVVAHRHRFIDWAIGVITNLAPEHIEAHGSFENYRKAKLDFLEYVVSHGGGVFLNRDDKYFDFFNAALGEKTSSFSSSDGWLKENVKNIETTDDLEHKVPDFLIGKFNEENIAVAVAVAKHLGISDEIILKALRSFTGVPGRMEFVRKNNYTAIVDYAHTPDSLEAVYKAAKPEPNEKYTHPRMICVLGAAGGGRDRWKRPVMGKIAGEYCDEIVLTDEDPYDENPEAILHEIEKGVKEFNPQAKNIYRILDRREAIQKAIDLMQQGDVMIATGKGSEDHIHVARGGKIPWNERQVVEELLAKK